MGQSCDPRGLRPEQELASAVLDGVVADLRHGPSCARYTLAVAYAQFRARLKRARVEVS